MTKRRSKGDGSVYFDAANGGWYGLIDLGRDAADQRHRVKTSAQRNKTLALHAMRELRTRIDAGEVITHDRATVQDAVDDFIARGLPAGRTTYTRYSLSRSCKRFAQSCGGRTLRTLTVRDVEDYLQELADEGKTSRTISTARAIAARVLDHAARQGWLTPGRNVVKLARMPEARARKERPQLSDADVVELITAAGSHRFAPLLALVAVTGCRIGEATAQAWSDIDTERNIVHITATVRHEADGSVTRQEPKCKSFRSIEIPAELTRMLVAHRRRTIEDLMAAGVPVPDLAFPSANGTLLNRRNLDRWLDEVAARAGIKLMGWHDLRHALGTALSDDGAPLTRSSAVLGHKSIETTATVYTHPRTGIADAAVPRGERLLAALNQSAT